MNNGQRFDAAFSGGKERQALADALRLAKQMQQDHCGPTFPGRTHKLREEQIPELLRILREGLKQ